MVNPIDYTMNVLNPVEGYMQGLKFGEGIQTDRLNRELAENQEGRAQETFAMQKEDRARAIQQQQAAAAARAASARKQQEQAVAGREALISYYEKIKAGTDTSDDLRNAMVYYPDQVATFNKLKNSVSSESLNSQIKLGRQLLYAVNQGEAGVKAAENLLQQRIDASTDDGQRAAFQAELELLRTDPAGFEVNIGMPLSVIDEGFYKFRDDIKGKEFKVKSDEIIGGIASVQLGEDGTTRIVDIRTNTAVTGEKAKNLLKIAKSADATPLSGIGKLVDDFNNGLISQEQFDIGAAKLSGSGVSVTNVLGDKESTLEKELAKGNADRVTESIIAGQNGARRLADLDLLGDLLSQVDTGASASVKGFLGKYGLKTEGSDLIEASNAIIKRLVPTARQPGSGPMSDKDLALFEKTFPNLINTPEGNALILKTLEQISQYEIAEGMISGKIADWAMTPKADRAELEGQGLIISPQNGRKAILELPKVIFSAIAPDEIETPTGVLTKEKFLLNPTISFRPKDEQDRIWEAYKRIEGID